MSTHKPGADNTAIEAERAKSRTVTSEFAEFVAEDLQCKCPSCTEFARTCFASGATSMLLMAGLAMHPLTAEQAAAIRKLSMQLSELLADGSPPVDA